jgi:chloramphenicol O-acetyltransferase
LWDHDFPKISVTILFGDTSNFNFLWVKKQNVMDHMKGEKGKGMEKCEMSKE